ncbi:uncharacterized protein UMAG_03478 [Mycosarcoma maydis]|uniref:Protein CSN12 homolog n=1 Tax=Mycosarcoma maydis TaxID=5270 RepID=CSN12_MYCMD|nr:uncharacterized protein UMAG_03478 [Ustilago maydis 521]Q4P8T5.1 RecName: Full=Protein CSN12 homolog [Ustilago maydis 521]KIS68384.1 hypothetical protein UMAG_03478 [Ustilago maydis 521]|eukprot:XP_011389934.1 hypothetical protein UMAG_03478 [Ustilago maydis 521]
MKPSIFADAVITACQACDGHALAELFAIGGGVAASALLELGDVRPGGMICSLRKCSGYLGSPWEDMCVNHLRSLYSFSLASSLPASASDAVDGEGKTRSERLGEAFDAYNSVVSAFVRYFSTLTPGRWALPLLRILCLNLRWLAVQADSAAHIASVSNTWAPTRSTQPNKRLEECARQLNKAFSACIADRNADMHESRKWGTYEVVGMVFKTYFRLKSVGLCRNILRAINAADLPDLCAYPRSQQVTFRYYVGVLAFLNEEYDHAELELQASLQMCHRCALINQGLILTYLIPVKLLKGSLPHPSLLDPTTPIGRKLAVYQPFTRALRTGDVKAFDQALANPTIESSLVKRGTYIAIERARDATLRTLLKTIWLSLPLNPTNTRPTRLTLTLLHHATSTDLIRLKYSIKELEWILATLIYKGYVKGYIAHERGVLVLSAKDAFPALRTVAIATT